MDEPTEEQERWFWGQCGFKILGVTPADELAGSLWGKIDMTGFVIYPGETTARATPPIDTNNLFRYEPLTARGYHIKTDTYKREVAGIMGQCSWVTIEDSQGKVVACCARKELKDALFWAIYVALGGKEQ